MNVIEAEDLCKTYGINTEPVHAVDHVTLSLEEGSVNALCGKSGSGKSTLLRLLGLQEKQDRGIIRMNGKEVSGDDEERSSIRLRHIYRFYMAGLQIDSGIYNTPEYIDSIRLGRFGMRSKVLQ